VTVLVIVKSVLLVSTVRPYYHVQMPILLAKTREQSREHYLRTIAIVHVIFQDTMGLIVN